MSLPYIFSLRCTSQYEKMLLLQFHCNFNSHHYDENYWSWVIHFLPDEVDIVRGFINVGGGSGLSSMAPKKQAKCTE